MIYQEAHIEADGNDIWQRVALDSKGMASSVHVMAEPNGRFSIWILWLRPDIRGAILGGRIIINTMKWLMEKAGKMGKNVIHFHCLETNDVARRLYDGLGFKVYAIDKGKEYRALHLN